MTKRIALAYLANVPGLSRGAWKHPDVDPSDAMNFEAYKHLAQTAEKGFFDLFFKEDTLGAPTEELEVWTQWPIYHHSKPDPVTLLSALAGVTEYIGLGGTTSTTFTEPFHIARTFATLDHLSNGRSAWNIVTSGANHVARNFGHEKLPPHDKRYEAARESYEVVTSYWDTWEDDAFVYDKDNSQSFLPEKFHATRHHGEFFNVHGGLPIPRAPQGYPVIIQAGASEAGKEFAAETAEVVFGVGANVQVAKEFYEDLKGRMAKFGRDPNSLKVLSGLNVVVAETESAAREKHEQLQNLVPLQVRLKYLSEDLETPLLDLPLDQPIPPERIPKEATQHQQYFNEIVGLIKEGLTLGEIAMKYNRSNSAVVGDPKQIANHMQEWIDEGAGDGFMLEGQWTPGNLEDFVKLVIPELQKRGMVRTTYEGSTLRDHLGLSRPDNQHAVSRDGSNVGPKL